MSRMKSFDKRISKTASQNSLDAEIQPLALSGSQMNLAPRVKAARKPGSRPASACHTTHPRRPGGIWRRPASADMSSDSGLLLGGPRRLGSTHSLCETSARQRHVSPEDFLRSRDFSGGGPTCGSRLAQCQRAGFCGPGALIHAANTGQRVGFCGSDSLVHNATAGERFMCGAHPCRNFRQCNCGHACRPDPDAEILSADVMRYAYTAESARLLQTLLREPWKSDGSENSSPRSATSQGRPPSPETQPANDEVDRGKHSHARQITGGESYSSKEKDRGDFAFLYDKRVDSKFDQRGVEKVRIEKKVDIACQEKIREDLRSKYDVKKFVKNYSSYEMKPDRGGLEKENKGTSEESKFENYSSLTSRERNENSCPSSARSLLEYKTYRYEAKEYEPKKASSEEAPTSPHTEQKLAFSNNFQDQLENLDSVPSKDSGRTESTLIVREAETKETTEENTKEISEQSAKEEDIDFKFQRWFPEFQKQPEKNVRFCEENDSNNPVLIDLTEEIGTLDRDKKSDAEALFDAEKKLKPEKLKPDPGVATTPRDSTLEDLVNILHVLETEDTSHNNDRQSTKIPSPTPQGTPLEPKPELLTEGRVRSSTLDPSSGPQTEGPLGTQVAEIFQYLDQAERCSDIVKPAVCRTTRPNGVPTVCDSSVPRMEELLCRSSVDLAQEVLSLRLQAEEQAGGIRLLQQTVAELKDAAREARAAHQAELSQAANEAEAALLRHQKMVKQLLAEKKNLNDKMAAMMAEIKSAEERHQRNLKAMEERHLVEIQRVKETHAAAEKLKREKWIDVKTQKIKEMTVKGLEPELSRMAARQQQELAEQRSLHRAELEAVELRAARRTTELMDELRAELTRDKEEALKKEAALQRTRWEKRLEEESNTHEEEVKRLKEELRREKDRMAALEAHVQEQLSETRRTAERERERDRAALMREMQERQDELHRLHQIELKSLKEAVEMEKDVWMNNYKKIQANKLLEREADLRHQYKRERDRDIEIAIERLETEATKARLELTEAAENKLRRLREKLEGEVKEAEAENANLRAKLMDVRQTLAEREDQITELTAKIRHLQAEFAQLKKLCDEMTSERSDLRRILREELDEQLVAAQTSVEAARLELAELKTVHAVQMAQKDQLVQQIRVDGEKELQHVYNRVKMTIQKKDEALEAQKEQYKVALERCSHLEQMLQQQRRNLLLK